MDNTHLASLAACRATAYAAFGQRRDALSELCATLLTTRPVPSLPFLSVQPQQQHRWGSLYDALAVGQIDRPGLEQALATYPLAGGEPIYAVDVSVWPRCDAETSPESGMYYHASRHAAGHPIVAGWASSWIAQLGVARERWTAPLRVQRLPPWFMVPSHVGAQTSSPTPGRPRQGAVPRTQGWQIPATLTGDTGALAWEALRRAAFLVGTTLRDEQAGDEQAGDEQAGDEQAGPDDAVLAL